MACYLYDRLTAQGASDGIFLETPGGRALSYGQVALLSAQIAHALKDCGTKAGDIVAVQIEKSPEAVMLMLACLRVGAVFLPLNTAYTASEIAYFLGDSHPRVFVCDPSRAGELTSIATAAHVAHVLTLDSAGQGSLMERAADQPKDFENAVRGADDLAALLYTSGTTGRSKGAMLTQDNLASNAQTLCDTWHFSSRDVLLHALPIYHTHGLFVAINVTMMAGAKLLFLPKFDADQIISLMPQATCLMGVPTFYTRLIEHPGLTAEAVKPMRLFISGSAPLLAETHRIFAQKTGMAILERYGMTETGMITSNPYQGARRAGTVGLPLADVEVRVCDPTDGHPMPQGDIGVIEVRGPNVFKGYWEMPEKTAAEFRKDGFFITGDLGLVDGEGYVHIVGRGKDLVITGGFNVYPKEVESEIDALEGVQESAIIGLPHRDFGEAVTAVIVLEKGANLDEAQVLAALAPKLAKFKLPKKVIFASELPRNTMGKVQKNRLRDMFSATYG
ncbi:MAG: malonyl-CoA synthase [Hyphomicrobiales bacterium]|nr:malonyl-CoA synthase [Hyphomicrobiales bacterium]MDE2114357.1 malonyl-CoA synthase [Hyphomicrobiales bacterium]